MKKNINTKQGFGLTGILIGIIIALVVGAGGVYVVKNTDLVTKDANDNNIVTPLNNNLEHIDVEIDTKETTTVKNKTEKGITLLSPNGGEKYKIGEVINIKWDTGDPGIWNIELVNIKNNKVYEIYSLGDPIRPPGNITGLKSLTIPMSVEPGDYYIKIYPARLPFEVSDQSDKPFTILKPEDVFLEIISPNGGETWEAGTTKTISWQYNNDIESLGYNTFLIRAVLVKYPNNLPKSIATFKKSIFDIPTFFDWEIPWYMSSDDYKIEISYTTCASSDCGGMYSDGHNYIDKSDESIYISTSTVENFLTISNRQSSPMDGEVYPGDKDIEFFSFDLTAPATEDVTLTMLEIDSEDGSVFVGIENPRIITTDERIIKLLQFNDYYIDNSLWILENSIVIPKNGNINNLRFIADIKKDATVGVWLGPVIYGGKASLPINGGGGGGYRVGSRP